jgi:two-component system LytT family sensor kinase
MNPEFSAAPHVFPAKDIANGNKTRWREYEFILVTIICLAGILGLCWKLLSMTQADLDAWYGAPFSDNHFSFNFYLNVLLPRAGLLLLIYFCYLRMNLYILPRLLHTEALEKGAFRLHFSLSARIALEGASGEALRRSLWALLYIFLLILFLGAGWGISLYYQSPFLFSLPDGRSTVLGLGLQHAFTLVIAYTIYASLREAAIRWMDAHPERRSYRVSITNQVGGLLLIYFSLGWLVYSFDVIRDHGGAEAFYTFYFALFPPALLACLSNLFWLFPLKKERSIFKRPIFWRLVASTGLWSLPFILFLPVEPPGAVVPAFISLWLALLLVVTPISLLIYQQRKDKILQLRGLETELGQSRADLEFLRSQINPHFLFNVLNTLYGTALQENAGQTAGGIQQLGDMMRFMLHENNMDRIPMEKEIGYLKNYIALQELRTQSSPTIRIDARIDEAFCHHEIAPMLLIPFVENAFKHGISLREPSWIKIRLSCDPKSIHFEIRNSVHSRQGDDPEKDKSGIGMKNVLHRLNLAYPGRHEFYVHQDEREFFVQLAIRP